MARITEQDRMIYLQKVVDNIQSELNENPELFEHVYHGSEVEVMFEVKNRINDLLEMHKQAYKRTPLISRLRYRLFPGS